MSKPFDPIVRAVHVAKISNRGEERRFCKARVWGSGYNGVATADRYKTAIAERVTSRKCLDATSHVPTVGL